MNTSEVITSILVQLADSDVGNQTRCNYIIRGLQDAGYEIVKLPDPDDVHRDRTSLWFNEEDGLVVSATAGVVRISLHCDPQWQPLWSLQMEGDEARSLGARLLAGWVAVAGRTS